MKVFAQVIDFMSSVEVLFCEEGMDGRLMAVVAPLTLELVPMERGLLASKPTLSITMKEAQRLVTALWEAGVRPTTLADPRGEIQRIDAHLQDMRKLVFEYPKTIYAGPDKLKMP